MRRLLFRVCTFCKTHIKSHVSTHIKCKAMSVRGSCISLGENKSKCIRCETLFYICMRGHEEDKLFLIMKHYTSVLLVSIFIQLNLTSSISDEYCREIIAGDTGIYTAQVGGDLQINCTCNYANCFNKSCNISWFKWENGNFVQVIADSHTDYKQIRLGHSEAMFLLCIKNIQISNAGIYRCKIRRAESQNINVEVYGHKRINISQRNENSTIITNKGWQLDLYTDAGIIAFVIIVIFISVILILHCKGAQKRETQSSNQKRNLGNQPPSDIPAAVTQTSSRNFIHTQVSLADGNDTQSRRKKKKRSVAYCTLNHDLLPTATGKPRRPQEESLMYADIRV
ncbi:uncharacterized protein btla isoform X2 [Stigmatopora nigra]